jgi:hypothetical protein
VGRFHTPSPKIFSNGRGTTKLGGNVEHLVFCRWAKINQIAIQDFESSRVELFSNFPCYGIGTRGMCHTHFADLAVFGRILPNGAVLSTVATPTARRINFGDS